MLGVNTPISHPSGIDASELSRTSSLRYTVTQCVLSFRSSRLSFSRRQRLRQKTVSFPTVDGGVVFADEYGAGEKNVILAHGGQFNKESWAKQAQILRNAGFHALAIDFRGYGNSHGPGDSDPRGAPLHFDVLAAVRYLGQNGAGAFQSLAAAWAEAPRETHRSVPSRARSIAWYCLVPPQTIRPTGSSRQVYTLWRAMTLAAMVRASPGFVSSTRDPRNPKS